MSSKQEERHNDAPEVGKGGHMNQPQQAGLRFNGPDYDHDRDSERLTGQIERVFACMKDGQWRTLGQIASFTRDPEASISAQLRHLRKERFGGHAVDKDYLGDGLYRYRLVVRVEAH